MSIIDGAETLHTPYGSVTRAGRVTFVQGESQQLTKWAQCSTGAFWPCSVLRRMDKVEATFSPNGDLIDLETWRDGDMLDGEDMEAAELNAWVTDVLALA